MEDLIERLEKATEGSRELDADIFEVIGGELYQRARVLAAKPCGAPEDTITEAARGYAPRYTTSVDAALTLVPEGRLWSIGSRVKVGGFVAVLDQDSKSHTGATPPLALCIATLRARGK